MITKDLEYFNQRYTKMNISYILNIINKNLLSYKLKEYNESLPIECINELLLICVEAGLKCSCMTLIVKYHATDIEKALEIASINNYSSIVSEIFIYKKLTFKKSNLLSENELIVLNFIWIFIVTCGVYVLNRLWITY